MLIAGGHKSMQPNDFKFETTIVVNEADMIKKINKNDINECVSLIRESFSTVAEEFGLTVENSPRFTAFSTTEERLIWHIDGEHRPMYAFRTENVASDILCSDGRIVGYYSLLLQDNSEIELNNMCVHPAYRHKGIGEKLVRHAFDIARELNCKKMNIGIVEENKLLRKWYERLGFVHTGTQKFDFFAFTCGYMEKKL